MKIVLKTIDIIEEEIKKENITKWANKMTKRDIETFNRICKSTEDKVKKRYIKGGN